MSYGADGTANVVTSTATNPLPVALSDVDNLVLDTINTAVVATQAAVEGTLTVGSHAVTNAGTFAVQIADTSFAVADGNALGEGVLVQGDDGTDRKNIHVDATTGDVQVDVTNTVTVASHAVTNAGTFATQATLQAGTAEIGKLAAGTAEIGTVTANLSATDNAVLDTIDGVLDTINAKLVTGTVIGDVNLGATDNAVLDSIVTNQSARSTGGHTAYTNVDTSALDTIKASAGTLYWLHVTSTDATVAYVSFYDAASPTLGTSPKLMFPIPTQGDGNGAGLTINFGPHGVEFTDSIKIGAATTITGSTDPGLNVVVTNVGYE